MSLLNSINELLKDTDELSRLALHISSGLASLSVLSVASVKTDSPLPVVFGLTAYVGYTLLKNNGVSFSLSFLKGMNKVNIITDAEVAIDSEEEAISQMIQEQLDAQIIELQAAIDSISSGFVVEGVNTDGSVLDIYQIGTTKKGLSVGRFVNNEDFARDAGIPQGLIIDIVKNAGKGKIRMMLPKYKRSTILMDALIVGKKWDKFQKKAQLPFCFGEYVDATPLFLDIEDCVHMAFCGQTKSGKSVSMISGLYSLLSCRDETQVQLVTHDKKQTNLAVFNDFPHVESKCTHKISALASKLESLVMKMDARNSTFAKHGVQDLQGFNKLDNDDSMPYILLAIDELYLIAVDEEKEVVGETDNGKEILEYVRVRVFSLLTQLATASRAAGIHLLLGVQRFDASTFPPQLKANVPWIAGFRTRDTTNSRLILGDAPQDCSKLQGKGDCYLKVEGEGIVRCHAAISQILLK